MNGGSHEGESIIERAIDRWLEQPGRAFVSSAGNLHYFRTHASGTLNENETCTLQWRTGGKMPLPSGGLGFAGDDTTANEMEIWYSSGDLFDVEVTDPNSNSTGIVSAGSRQGFNLPSGETVTIDSERFTLLNGDARIYILILPPSSATGSFDPITPGVWQVKLTAVRSQSGRFDAWIERDRVRIERPHWEQSFFDGSDFDGQMTLGTPATARRSIAVANYIHRNGAASISISSSRGLTRDGRPKPEVAAPGTDIWSANALGGRLNPKHDPNDPKSPDPVYPMRFSLPGTSMSAPHVAGIVAQMFQKNPNLRAAQVAKILTAAANPLSGITGHDIAWGFGRVDAKAALDLLDLYS